MLPDFCHQDWAEMERSWRQMEQTLEWEMESEDRVLEEQPTPPVWPVSFEVLEFLGQNQ